MAKLFYYDVETTGVDYRRNGIHQISAIIEINGEEVEQINYKVQPNPKALITEEAMKIGCVTQEQIMQYPAMGLVYTELISILEKYVSKYDKTQKFHLVGYNNRSFDDKFFRAWFVQNGDKYFGSWFWSDSIDVLSLASNRLKEDRYLMKNFKLSTVAEVFAIDVKDESLHDASYDIYLTKEIYKKVQEL